MSKRLNYLPQNRLPHMLGDLQRHQQDLKTPQPVGADVLSVQSLPTAGTVDLYGPVTIGVSGSTAGDVAVISFTSTPNDQTLTLWNFAWSLYVDPTNFLSSGLPSSISQWPFGSGVNTTLVQDNLLEVKPWLDYATSSDSLNTRVYYFFIHNSDTSPHTVYVAFKSYLPNLNQT